MKSIFDHESDGVDHILLPSVFSCVNSGSAAGIVSADKIEIDWPSQINRGFDQLPEPLLPIRDSLNNDLENIVC